MPDHRTEAETDVITPLTSRIRTSVAALARRMRRAPSSDRGASLIEFGLVAPIFLSLILGGITTGMSYNANNTLNNGARETARYAATLPVDSGLNQWLRHIAGTAVTATSGDLSPTTPGQRICVAYVHPNGSEVHDQTVTLVEQEGARQILPGRTCFDDGRPDDERRVQVVLGRDSEIQTIVYNRVLDLEARSVVRYERGG